MGGRPNETEHFLSGRPANRERLAGHVLVLVVAKLLFFVALFVIVDGFILVL